MVKNSRIALYTQNDFKAPILDGDIPHHIIVWYDSESRLWFADVETSEGFIIDVGQEFEPREMYHINSGYKQGAIDSAIEIGKWHNIPIYVKSGGAGGKTTRTIRV
jgi:hypothetical protein